MTNVIGRGAALAAILAIAGDAAAATGPLRFEFAQLRGPQPAARAAAGSGPAAATLTTFATFKGTGDAAGPVAGPVLLGKKLYLGVAYGGAHGAGAIVSFDPTTSQEDVLYSFSGGADGGTPNGALTVFKGKLYGVTQFGGVGNGTVGNGTLFEFDPASMMETVLHSFTGADGVLPSRGLVVSGNIFYGATVYGGGSGNGTVFSFDTTSGSLSSIYNFAGGSADGANPIVRPILVGKTLYGTTAYGGAGNAGVLFSIDPATGAETVLRSMTAASDGATPYCLLLDVKGTLWGTASGGGANGGGTVFKYAIDKGAFNVVHDFGASGDGTDPRGGVVLANGKLWGGTFTGGANGEGTLYTIDPSTGAESIQYSYFFGTGPEYPSAEALLVGGKLYGTAMFGGSNGQGTLGFWDVVANTGAVIYSFTGTTPQEPIGVVAAKGGLIATAANGGTAGLGTIMSVPVKAGMAKTIFDFTQPSQGFFPLMAPVSVGGALVGTAYNGGNTGCSGIGCGVVYSVNPATGVETVLYAFGNATGDGYLPTTSLTNVNGTLFGSTLNGGTATGGACTYGCGTVFSIVPSAPGESVVHSFANTPDGAYLSNANLLGSGGVLYGVTEAGGANGQGTIFSIDPATGMETVLYSFSSANNGGTIPYGGLVSVGGVLYGSTLYGGSGGGGTVFRFNPATRKYATLHGFAGSDGSVPEAGLLAVGTTLYGSAAYGGVSGIGCTSGCGTLFSLNIGTGAYTVLHSFAGGADGGNPAAPLVRVGTGTTLYGATGSGGASGIGTVFSLQP